MESLFLGSKTFLLQKRGTSVFISFQIFTKTKKNATFFLQNHKKTINFCWKWNPKSHHPHIQIERNINKSHPHVQEEDQDWRQNRKKSHPNVQEEDCGILISWVKFFFVLKTWHLSFCSKKVAARFFFSLTKVGGPTSCYEICSLLY